MKEHTKQMGWLFRLTIVAWALSISASSRASTIPILEDEYPVSVDASEEKNELASYLGENLEAVSNNFTDMRSGSSMGVYYFLNDAVYLGSTRSDHAVTYISVSGGDSEYEILGLCASMDMAEASERLREMGFQETNAEGIYRDEREYYVDLRSLEDEVRSQIVLRALFFSEITGKTELAHYFGASFETVHSDFPGLKLSVEDDKAILADEYVSFTGDYGQGGDIYSVTVNSIEITGKEAPYCVYSLVPGINESSGGESGLSEGGSGEWLDPMGNVIYWYGVDDAGNPVLHMYTPG